MRVKVSQTPLPKPSGIVTNIQDEVPNATRLSRRYVVTSERIFSKDGVNYSKCISSEYISDTSKYISEQNQQSLIAVSRNREKATASLALNKINQQNSTSTFYNKSDVSCSSSYHSNENTATSSIQSHQPSVVESSVTSFHSRDERILLKLKMVRDQIFQKNLIVPSTFMQKSVAQHLLNIPINKTIFKDTFVIVDTDILVSHLEVVQTIMALKINGVVAPVIVIPWMTIQELDCINKNCFDSDLKATAQPAFKFVYSNLLHGNPQVKGQTPADAAQQQFTNGNASDGILHCCLQILAKHHHVFLLSNSIYLRNKAEEYDIITCSYKEVVSKLDPFCFSQEDGLSKAHVIT